MARRVVARARSSGRARGSPAAASRARRSRGCTAAARARSRSRRAASAGNSASRSLGRREDAADELVDLERVALDQLAHQLLVASRIASALLRSTLVAPAQRVQPLVHAAQPTVARRRAGADLLRRSARAVRAGRERAELERPEAARARARARDGRPPRTSAAPGACGPRGSSSSSSCGAEPAHARRRGAAVLELDAVAQPLAAPRALGRPPPTPGAVGLRHLEARVRQQVRELAVVGQQDQPGAVGVEPPDRIEPARRRRRAATTVGRPWVSRAVETTPSGLLSA